MQYPLKMFMHSYINVPLKQQNKGKILMKLIFIFARFVVTSNLVNLKKTAPYVEHLLQSMCRFRLVKYYLLQLNSNINMLIKKKGDCTVIPFQV